MLDEYGTPFVPLNPNGTDEAPAGYSATLLNPMPSFGINYAGWNALYRPKFPPYKDYDQWPERLRRWVPRAWSGDLTIKPVRDGLTVAEVNNPRNLVYNDELNRLEWNYQNDLYLQFWVEGFLFRLADNGWGRYWRVRSDKTGQPGVPLLWNRELTIKETFEVGAFFSTILRSIAKVVSFIPGIGTVAASVLGGIGALVAGEDFGSAMLEAAANAIPGGGLAKDALKTGVQVAQSLAEGKSIGEALLDGARKALEAQGVPAEVLQAFDIGVAVGTGKGLETVGFKALSVLVKGSDILDKGTKFIDSAGKANVLNASVEKFLVVDLSKELYHTVGPAIGDHILPYLNTVAMSDELRAMGSAELGEVFGISEPAARAVQAITQGGVINEARKEEILKTVSQRTWEKWGAKAFEKGPLNMKYQDALLAKRNAVIMLSVADDIKWTEEYKRSQNMSDEQFASTAGRVGRTKDPRDVVDPGRRVQLRGYGTAEVAKSPSLQYHLQKVRDMMTGDQAKGEAEAAYLLALGVLAEGHLTKERVEKLTPMNSAQMRGWLYGLRTYLADRQVHPDVRVQLAAAGQAVAAVDPQINAARRTLPDAKTQRGFDIAVGQMMAMGQTAYDVDHGAVRSTLEHDAPHRLGFDTATALIRGRERGGAPAGMNAGEAAGFATIQGLVGNPDGNAKAAIASNLIKDPNVKAGAATALNQHKGFFRKVLEFFGLA